MNSTIVRELAKYGSAISSFVPECVDKKLKEKFFPENVLQERHENILTFYAKYGDDFLHQLFAARRDLKADIAAIAA